MISGGGVRRRRGWDGGGGPGAAAVAGPAAQDAHVQGLQEVHQHAAGGRVWARGARHALPQRQQGQRQTAT